MDINAYLQRINYTGSLEPTAETLRALHRAHMLAVPFENLDIHIGQWISLDPDAIFDKLVTRNRGGFCFEQNGLFAAVLRELGFNVTLLEANVHLGDGVYSIPFDHLALMVQLEERWLADVGFGDSFIEPLRLDDSNDQEQNGNLFCVIHDKQQGYYSRPDEAGDWQIQYRFFLQPRQLTDFTEACHYMQTSPESHFTQKRVASLATPQGRITLRDSRLIITKNGQREELEIRDEAEFHALLHEYFNMTLIVANS